MTLKELKKILYVMEELYIAFTSNDYILTHDEYCKFSEKIETAFEILENKIKEKENKQ